MTTIDNHGWRARVLHEDPVLDGIRVFLGYRGHKVRNYVTGIYAHGVETASVDPGIADVPTLTLPTEVAHVLLDALAEHFGGTSTQQAARADFVHERGRVDKLLDAVTRIATRAADVEPSR